MKKLYQYAIIFGALMMTSCDRNVGETVETAYQEPLPEVLVYKFQRNGSSSVNTLACQLIIEPVDYIFNSYLKDARIFNQYYYEGLMKYYQIEGIDGAIPYNEIAASDFQKKYQTEIQQDITAMMDISAKISGYQSDNIRNREAAKGVSGYVGNSLGDLNLSFVDERGLAPAEAFYYMILGAIQMDKIFGTHLTNEVLQNMEYRTQHENLMLLQGRNYTALEHHWDLSYGYFNRLKPLVQADGLPVLTHSETKIYNALVQGRYEMGRYYYDEMTIQADIIRVELAKAIVVKTMNLLAGNNTLANLNEEAGYSFKFLSQAYGLIYSLQFLRNNNGEAYFSRSQVQNILNKMMGENGFWDKERLLSDENTTGSLKQIATEIGKPFGLTLSDIKR